MNGRAILIGFVAAVAVAVSGIAASDAFAEPEIALELRGVRGRQWQLGYLNDAHTM